ncbi:hypothetical protein [Acidobacterium sp. S8]|uniref:hypothetical protein n=1 Tax=Acidobacterium sp. S8 TaxID=1641854 RepID=UPI00131A9AD5|nr:hypothetical protein [Acidobacterium sp. S8]
MEPIEVPVPPKHAFNKQRPISDLVKKQIEHFKHLEAKLPAEVRAALPQHRIITEDDAARYIAPMTQFLVSGKVSGKVPVKTRPKTITQIRPAEGLSIAAVADTGSTKLPAKKRSSAAKKKSSPRSGKSSSSPRVTK